MPIFDHDPTHKSEVLLSNQVVPFFEELSETFRGSEIRIAKGAAIKLEPDQLPAHTLERLELSRHGQKDTLLIEIAGAEPISTRVVLTWVTWDKAGRVVGIEITDNKTQKLKLFFSPD